jgi:hypothetical protein
MPEKGIWRPISVLALGMVLIAALLARTETTAPIARSQNSYPAQTETARAGTNTNQTAYPPNVTVSATAGTPAPAQTAATSTAAAGTVTAIPTPSVAPTLTLPAQQVQAPTATQTLTPTPGLEGTVPCSPGVELSVSGKGPPRAPVLLYFGRRIVGGGSVGADGTFTLPLVVGVERGGEHIVSVRVRGSDEVLTEFTCIVPDVTPTPVPGRRPFP